MSTLRLPPNMPRIKVGLALSDAGLYHRETMRLPEDLQEFCRLFQEKLGTDEVFFELQPEMPWLSKQPGSQCVPDMDNSWYKLGHAARQLDQEGPYREIVETFHGPRNIFGVHQSIRDMDVLSQDMSKKLETIQSSHQAMEFAHSISADYFVFHLAQSKDYWDWDRSEQIAIALRVFQELADYYRNSGFSFTPLLENLEFPKFPATATEIVSLFRTCREFLPNLKLCLDLPHLWHSRLLLIENREKFKHLIPEFPMLETRFNDYLDYTLGEALPAEDISGADVFLYHLGGCWKHLTHEIPGLRPGESPFWNKMRLDEPYYAYNPLVEMNLRRALNRILRFNIENRRDVLIMIEIYQRNFNEMLEAARLIQEDLQKKALRISEKASKYAYLWE
jgi:hypothetical protein